MADKSHLIRLPLLPLRDLVIFPHMMLPIFIGREKSITALEKTISNKTDIVLASQKEARINNPSGKQIYNIGTAASVVQHLRLPDGTVKTIVEGRYRVRIENFVEANKCMMVDVERLEEPIVSNAEAEALLRMVYSMVENYIKLNKQIPPEVLARISSIDNCGELADVIASQLSLRFEDKQKILELYDPVKRLKEVLKLITKEIQVLKVEKKIRTRVKEQMEKSQKEYYLNEQLQAIQKELGDKDDFQKEVREMEKRAQEKKWTEEAGEKFKKELGKLKLMSPMSAEATVVRNYLDWMLELPWKDFSEEKSNIRNAEDILNQDHWGLEKVKERILEHLAVRQMTKDSKGPVICFVGPPGVGKTSLAQSIARCLNRSFCRISLGGVQDEAEIRGHRRTYVGAMPGKVIQALKKVKKGNPVMLLDEVDKMGGAHFRGDPSSALLEVLDPEQNHTFQDHYLEVDYDLSTVLFICTANSLHSLKGPLQDRMEVIPIEGYIEEEKVNIAKKYLIPRQVKKHGLQDFSMEFSDSILKEIIGYYTKEAGVRQLERSLAKVLRKVVKEVVIAQSSVEEKKGKKEEAKKKGASSPSSRKISVKKSADLEKFLGPRRYRLTQLEKESLVGLTTGLAWTEVGGDTLSVEAAVVPGTGKYTLTGQLGDVMKESCSASLSYVRSRGLLFGIKDNFFKVHDFHIHVPEGAIPKDGPSAGIAITTSLVSAILRIPVHRAVAMTGEITLRGRVLPIGGLKEKTLAAHRAQIKTVIIPADNQKDLKEIPKKALKDIEVFPVNHIDQVLVKALEIKTADQLFKSTPSSSWLKPDLTFPLSKTEKRLEQS
ncbi:MAG: endopeptidase La [Bdellovibrionales bacterium]|nr:endopeptidase La [Bdellovibrionales bacterium]